jgi:hypothetical protein
MCGARVVVDRLNFGTVVMFVIKNGCIDDKSPTHKIWK